MTHSICCDDDIATTNARLQPWAEWMNEWTALRLLTPCTLRCLCKAPTCTDRLNMRDARWLFGASTVHHIALCDPVSVYTCYSMAHRQKMSQQCAIIDVKVTPLNEARISIKASFDCWTASTWTETAVSKLVEENRRSFYCSTAYRNR